MSRVWVRILSLSAGLGLAGCASFDPDTAGLDYASAERDAYRTFAAAFSDVPFAQGAVSVVAADHGALRTFRLVPCQSGAAICGGSAHGPVGQVERTPDYLIVRGLYGREFWLSPGGDGAVVSHGQTGPLAWE